MGQPEEPRTYEVANPDYEDLQQLKEDISGARDSMVNALKRPSQTMQDGSAWTGPTAAKAFAQEISGRADEIPGLVSQLVQAVETEMANTPKTLTRTAHPLPHGAI